MDERDHRLGDDWFDEPGDDARRAAPPPAPGQADMRRASAAATGEPHRSPASGDGRRPPATVGGRRLVPAGSVLVAGLLGLVLALFLNAASIQRTARAMPFGAQRTLAVAAMRPVAALSHLLLIDRPSNAVTVDSEEKELLSVPQRI